ncbi:MAG: D-aminoacyl-tRNA deacylase [Planctomycetota bacterium]
MRVLLQRVSFAEVTAAPDHRARIEGGLLALVGIGQGDSEATVAKLAKKTAELRIFPDEAGKMNRDLRESGGSLLAVSQFTLYADLTKGRRPSFGPAEAPERAKLLFDRFCSELRLHGLMVETGVFGAHMQVTLCNDGPVTMLLEEIPTLP